MSSRTSEQTARELVDSFNRETARGGSGEQTRELARDIGGSEVRESERRLRSGRTRVRVQRPSREVMSPAQPEVQEASQTQTTSQTAQSQSDQIRQAIETRGITQDRLGRLYEAELLSQRRDRGESQLTDADRQQAMRRAEQDFQRQQIREQVAEQVISDVEPGLRRERPDLFQDTRSVSGGVVDVDRSDGFNPVSPSDYFFDRASTQRRRGEVDESQGRNIRAAGRGVAAFGLSVAGGALFAAESLERVSPVRLVQRVPSFAETLSGGRSAIGAEVSDFRDTGARVVPVVAAGVVAGFGSIGPSLRRSPITTGAEIAAGVVGPTLLARGVSNVALASRQARASRISSLDDTLSGVSSGQPFRVSQSMRGVDVIQDGGQVAVVGRGGQTTLMGERASRVTSRRPGDTVPVFNPRTNQIDFVDPSSMRVTSDLSSRGQTTLPRFGLRDQTRIVVEDTMTGRSRAVQIDTLQDFLGEQPGRFRVVGREDTSLIRPSPGVSDTQTTLFAVPFPILERRQVDVVSEGFRQFFSPRRVERRPSVLEAAERRPSVAARTTPILGVPTSVGSSRPESFLTDLRRDSVSLSNLVDTGSLSITDTASLTASSTDTSLATTSVTSSRSGSRSISDTSLISSPGLITQPVLSPPSTITIPRQVPRRGPPRVVRTPVQPRVTPRPRFGFDNDQDSDRDDDLFTVFVRRGGEFTPFASAGDVGGAVQLGTTEVGRTLAASFKVVDRRGQRVESGELARFAGDRFRPGKREAGVVVERRRFRLSSPSERGEIQSSRRNML